MLWISKVQVIWHEISFLPYISQNVTFFLLTKTTSLLGRKLWPNLLKLYKINMYNKNKKHADEPASFVKLSSSIFIKFPKEAQKILKFFKKILNLQKEKTIESLMLKHHQCIHLLILTKFSRLRKCFQNYKQKK